MFGSRGAFQVITMEIPFTGISRNEKRRYVYVKYGHVNHGIGMGKADLVSLSLSTSGVAAA